MRRAGAHASALTWNFKPIEKDPVQAAIRELSSSSTSTSTSTSTPVPGPAKPFVKWVGGKRQILPELEKHAPASFARYHEPFLGGGALFFHLRRRPAAGPFPAFLSDSNERLIRAYQGVQQSVEGVIKLLREYERGHSKEFFLRERDRKDVDSGTAVEVAAWFIYLNRTAFNGLYRVNSRNIFNVPFGKYLNPVICDEKNLRACAEALRDTELDARGFESILKRARAGDFVYFDPPYRPLTATSKFTDYTKEGFRDRDQESLRDLAHQLKASGVHVLLSNSSTPYIKTLYQDFKQIKVRARRSVNADPHGRGEIQELILK
jgi:DNA adenine methylase